MGDVVSLRRDAADREAACAAHHEALIQRAEAVVSRAWGEIARQPPAEQATFAVTVLGSLLGALAMECRGNGDFIGQCVAFAGRYVAAVEAGR